MASSNERYLCLRGLSDEQYRAIESFFIHNDWNFEDCTEEMLGAQALGEQQDVGDLRENPPLFERVLAGSEECPYCLCGPCITSEENRQLWWETESVPPHAQNRKLRKEAYRKFWTMLLHKGVWNHPDYKAKKQEALAEEGRRCVFHRRDILPECVLKTVRGWYPNPPGRNYMGHLWE